MASSTVVVGSSVVVVTVTENTGRMQGAVWRVVKVLCTSRSPKITKRLASVFFLFLKLHSWFIHSILCLCNRYDTDNSQIYNFLTGFAQRNVYVKDLKFCQRELCGLPQWYIYNVLIVVTVVASWGFVSSFLSLVDVSAARLIVHLTRFMVCWGVMDCPAALYVTVKRQRRRLRTYNVYIVLSET